MTFPEVVQQEGCISEEREDLLGAKIQPGSAARAAGTVAGTSVVLFKPALVITGNGPLTAAGRVAAATVMPASTTLPVRSRTSRTPATLNMVPVARGAATTES
jgi:hypothetical protein